MKLLIMHILLSSHACIVCMHSHEDIPTMPIQILISISQPLICQQSLLPVHQTAHILHHQLSDVVSNALGNFIMLINNSLSK